MPRWVSDTALRAFVRACFIASGVAEDDAEWASFTLVEADLQGLGTHGVMRLAAYVDGVAMGKINAAPKARIHRTGPVTSVIDGDNGLGCVTAKMAAENAVDLARDAGLGAVTVKRGNHAGALSIYTEWAAGLGMIGMFCCNAYPSVPPWGGSRAYFGTNPIALAAPTNGPHPVSIDLATSVVARGNIIAAAKRGDAIPEGWAIDESGRPTTDAKAALSGAVLPMAGAKGYALALLVEILAGVLSGAKVGDKVGSMFGDSSEPPGTGFFYLAIHPDYFTGYSPFLERIQILVDEIHQVPLAEGYEQVFVPGERRFLEKENRRKTGIPVPDETWEEFSALSARLDVTLPNCSDGS